MYLSLARLRRVPGVRRVGRRDVADRRHDPAPGRRTPPALRHRGAVPELPRGLPGRGVLRQHQPALLRRVVDQRRAGRRPVRLLRPPLDLGVGHLRRMARPRRRSLPRPVEPRHRQPGAGRRQPVRPCHPLRGRRDGGQPAAALSAADRRGVGAYVAVPVDVRDHGHRRLPAHRRDAATGHSAGRTWCRSPTERAGPRCLGSPTPTSRTCGCVATSLKTAQAVRVIPSARGRRTPRFRRDGARGRRRCRSARRRARRRARRG